MNSTKKSLMKLMALKRRSSYPFVIHQLLEYAVRKAQPELRNGFDAQRSKVLLILTDVDFEKSMSCIVLPQITI